jgi:hypothetical protein
MLTEAETERRAFDQQARLRQHLRADVKARARRDVAGQHRHKFPDAAAQDRFERLVERCEKDADAIACEAAEQASGQAARTGSGPSTHEAAYVEAYADALPALVATALARVDLTDPA